MWLSAIIILLEFVVYTVSVSVEPVSQSYPPLGKEEEKELNSRLPDGQELSYIRSEKQIYVDKTSYVLKLINSGKRCVLFTRPRRFGKSLLLDTLKCIFEGKKDLFSDTAIGRSNYDWKTYPVLYFDFSKMDLNNPRDLIMSFYLVLTEMRANNGLPPTRYKKNLIIDIFRQLLMDLYKTNGNQRVVVLIDEYDAPILRNLNCGKDLLDKFLYIIKDFFNVLKGNTNVHRVYATGISRFPLSDIHSGANQFTDITFDEPYSALAGFTESELQDNFGEHIHKVARKRGETNETILKEMREWYNGYNFSITGKGHSVYNPLSTIRYLGSNKAKSYWINTGEPHYFLPELLKYPDLLEGFSHGIIELSEAEIDELSLSKDEDRTKVIKHMLHTGYLTLKEKKNDNDFLLAFPNKEVNDAHVKMILQKTLTVPRNSSVGENNVMKWFIRKVQKMKTILIERDLVTFTTCMNNIIYQEALTPFHVSHPNITMRESIYHVIFHLTLKFMQSDDLTVENEKNAGGAGRRDLVVIYDSPYDKNKDFYMVFEFKAGLSLAGVALNQTWEKGYLSYYRNKYPFRDVIAVGLSFGGKLKDISECLAYSYPKLRNVTDNTKGEEIRCQPIRSNY